MKMLRSKPLFLILVLVLVIYPTFPVQAKVQNFPLIDMELTIPDDTIVLTEDTPNYDTLWEKARISDPKSEKKSFKDMGVQAILYNPNTQTTVRLLKNQSKKSSDVFNLSLLSENELNQFMKDLVTSIDVNATHSVERYEHAEIPFFHISIDLVKGNLLSSEVIYGTVVNGYVISYDIYKDNNTEPLDESFIKELVNGTHFTTFLDKAEVEKQGKQAITILVICVMFFIIAVVILILITIKSNKKQEALKKNKAKELNNFYQMQKQKEEQQVKDIALFTNRTKYSEEVFKLFSFYNHTFHHLKRWILRTLLYAILIIYLYYSKSTSITYIIAFALMFMILYFQGLSIEKTVKEIMKTYEKNKNMEATFTFYEDYYTLSGIQTSSRYPYYQIVEMKEYKEYIYLYLGTERALYLKNDCFENGAEDFKKFITEKMNINK